MVLAVQDVITHIEALHDLHTELLALATRKKQVLIDNQVDELSKIVAQESKLAKKVAEHEQAWLNAAHQTAAERGFAFVSSAVTMSDLIKVVPNAEDKRKLGEARTKLQAVVDEFRAAHELNQMLIQESLDFINYSLDLFTASPEDDATYGRPEKPTTSSGRSGIFDTRA